MKLVKNIYAIIITTAVLSIYTTQAMLPKFAHKMQTAVLKKPLLGKIPYIVAGSTTLGFTCTTETARSYIREISNKAVEFTKQALLYYKVKRICPSCNLTGNLTWTEAALVGAVKQNHDKLYPLISFDNHPDAPTIFSHVINLERQYLKKGYSTFVHGQSWDKQLLTKLYTDLWALRNEYNMPENFIFPRVPVGRKFFASTRSFLIRNELNTTGLGSFFLGFEQGIIFCNNTLVGNYASKGISSQYYYRNNQGEGNYAKNISLKLPFVAINATHLHDKYKKEIEELATLHRQAENLGNILLFAVPNRDLAKHVYLGRCGGIKTRAFIQNGWTTNVKFITEVSRRTQESVNGLEFILITEGLKPDSGIKVYNINLPEIHQTVEYKKFEQKYAELMKKIQQDLQKRQL